MRITPLEIRQKTFEKVFRGFDKDEVAAYLKSLSVEWEKIQDENKEIRIKLEAAEKEISKLREVENSLYKTLKTAEDTGANMIQQANRASELQLKETKMKADSMVQEAREKSRMILGKTEARAREIISNMLDEVKTLEQNFNMAMNLKESLISDLRNLSNETLERVGKFSEKKQNLSIEQYVEKAREYADNYDLHNFDAADADTEAARVQSGKPQSKAKGPGGGRVQQEDPGKAANDQRSFFDTI